METVEVDDTSPVETIKVVDCGELKDSNDVADVSVLKGTSFDSAVMLLI